MKFLLSLSIIIFQTNSIEFILKNLSGSWTIEKVKYGSINTMSEDQANRMIGKSVIFQTKEIDPLTYGERGKRIDYFYFVDSKSNISDLFKINMNLISDYDSISIIKLNSMYVKGDKIFQDQYLYILGEDRIGLFEKGVLFIMKKKQI